MSVLKSIVAVSFSMTLIFVLGCGSQKAPENTASETAVEHSADDGHDHSDHAGGGELTVQTHCPVMGGAIDKSLFVDKDGKRIYMCCEHCREELTKDFDANVKKLEEKGQKAEVL